MKNQKHQESAHSGYVRKSTLYMAVGVALLIGLYLGNLLTSLNGPSASEGTKRQVAAPTAQQATSQIPPEIEHRILDLEQAVIKNPADVDAWTHLGHLYFDTQQPKPAIRAYERSLELKPDDPDVITDLGVMFRADHQHDKALAAFEKAISLNPKHEIALFNRGIVLYFDMDKKKEGIAAWQQLLGVNPDAKAPDGTPVKKMIKELSAS